MAYMPAGEEDDDFDSDDGFIGIEVSHNVQGSHFATSASDSQDQKWVQDRHESKPFSWTHRSHGNSQNEAHEEPRKFPTTSCISVLTMEDFKSSVIKGNKGLVESCCNQGLDVNEPLQSGWTVLMYAANYSQADVVRLLLSRGANCNSHHDMFTVLMCACSSNSHDEEKIRECVQILAEAGANVNAKDRFHTTALMMASKEGHVTAVKELIKHGADINSQDSRGWTALTWATQRAARAVVVELLDSGANPNIQHLDKLTVKDLAAHLPTDEMLALLERRPANLVSAGSGDMPHFVAKNAASALDNLKEEACVRSTDLRYGELEVFLLGLDLAHLVGLFQQQLVDLTLLMTMTEQDLINAGVAQVGVRKKLLDAVHAVHKKDWQPSSLVSIHFNKQIRCSDAAAMLENSSKHLRYIRSTIFYVREQLKKHTDQILQPTDQVSSKHLAKCAEAALTNTSTLGAELQSLRTELLQEMKKRNVDPPDLVDPQKRETTRKSRRVTYLCSAVCLCLLVLAVYKRESLIHSHR